MKFLLVGQIKPDVIADGWPEGLDRLIEGEQAMAARYFAEGIVERAWSMAGKPGAVAIYNAADRDELDRLLGEYPLFKANYVQTEIIELETYAGFDADLPA